MTKDQLLKGISELLEKYEQEHYCVLGAEITFHNDVHDTEKSVSWNGEWFS